MHTTLRRETVCKMHVRNNKMYKDQSSNYCIVIKPKKNHFVQRSLKTVWRNKINNVSRWIITGLDSTMCYFFLRERFDPRVFLRGVRFVPGAFWYGILSLRSVVSPILTCITAYMLYLSVPHAIAPSPTVARANCAVHAYARSPILVAIKAHVRLPISD